MDGYVHQVYDVSVRFPKEEVYGVTSQLRRAALSVILNYIEGFARKHKNILRNFLEISYGSLKESIYLIQFSYKRKYILEKEKNELLAKADRIGRMLWGVIEKL